MPDDPPPAPAPADPNPPPAPAPAPAPADPPARPDYVPEKFWKDGAPDLEGMAKSYKELETKFHAHKPPDVPDAPDKYALKPETLPEGVQWDDGVAARFAAEFHKHGVGSDAAKAIVAAFVETEAGAHKAIAEAYEKQIADGNKALKEEWGGYYNTKIGKVKSVITTLGYDHNDPSLFSNPKVVSFLGKVVNMLSEDSVASMRGAAAPGAAFVNGAEEAHAIMSDPKHPDYEKYYAGDRPTIAKVKRLIDG